MKGVSEKIESVIRQIILKTVKGVLTRVFGFMLPVVTSRFPTGDTSRTLRVFENEENVNFYARMFVVFVQLGECDF